MREQLAETDRNAPCSLPFSGFWDAYHLASRVCGETGRPHCLLLCTLSAEDGRTAQDPVQFQKAMEQLESALTAALRKQDACTRYSRSQFLAMLPGLQPAEGETVARDVAARFKKLAGSTRLRLTCQVAAGEDEEPSKSE